MFKANLYLCKKCSTIMSEITVRIEEKRAEQLGGRRFYEPYSQYAPKDAYDIDATFDIFSHQLYLNSKLKKPVIMLRCDECRRMVKK